jgi:hypothetical protein
MISPREHPESPCRPPDPHTEAIALFDRFLQVFGDATRRFGSLFPYNHLRVHVRAMLAGKVARVTIRGPDGAPLGIADVAWRDGELRRAPEGGEPALAWVVSLPVLERVAAEPWTYLAQPGRLGFAWFPGPTAPLHADPADRAAPAGMVPASATR